MRLLFLLLLAFTAQKPVNVDYPQRILEHRVILEDGRLQPAMCYDSLLHLSMNFVVYSPEQDTPNGPLPYYLITSQLENDGSFMPNQNNQAGNLFYAMETFKRYYAYTGDLNALKPVTLLLEQINKYLTPSDWVWAGMPRTQDDTPDGIYDDERGEPDKMCMVALALIDYARFTGESRYLAEAEDIAQKLLAMVKPGDATNSPLPYRVNMRTGEVIDPYCANWIMAVKMIDELRKAGSGLDAGMLQEKKKLILDWIFEYPVKNGYWSGYFEDVHTGWHDNVNQYSPLETARYMLENSADDKRFKPTALELIDFVHNRFGYVSRYGATSICEQDVCCVEMGSHTARYASVLAKAFDITGKADLREEARASLALASYSACNSFIDDSLAVNPTGIGYTNPWYSDSYFDYLTHFIYAFEQMPELIPQGTNHLFYSSSMVKEISYGANEVSYIVSEQKGVERLKLNFKPKVYVDGKPLKRRFCRFGKYRGVDNVLTIKHKNCTKIEIKAV